MAFQVSPGVAIREIDLTNVVPAVSTSIGATVIDAIWGPIGEITTVTSEKDLVAAVKTKVRVFNEQYLNDFNTTFRYSKLVEAIDSVDTNIISNSTEVVAYKIGRAHV